MTATYVYTCTLVTVCMDSLIQSTICKHVHLVVRCTSAPNTPCKHIPERHTDNTGLFLQKTSEITVSRAQKRLQQKISTMSGYISQCEDLRILHDIESHLNSALSTFKVLPSSTQATIMPKHKFPHNKGISQQRRFHSTKKRSKVPQIRLAKPDRSKREYIHNNLMANTLYSGTKLITQSTKGKKMHETILHD